MCLIGQSTIGFLVHSIDISGHLVIPLQCISFKVAKGISSISESNDNFCVVAGSEQSCRAQKTSAEQGIVSQLL